MTERSSGLAMILALGLAAPISHAQEPTEHGGGHGPGAAHSAYAGQEEHGISSLSDDEVRGLLEGHGAGMARPAELHHYPGPRHVLDLREELALSEAQQTSIQEVYERMHREVLPLGARYVEAERLLDALFAGGKVDETALRAATSAAAQLSAELRVAHLRAHVATRALLTPQQVARYDRLRGYWTGQL